MSKFIKLMRVLYLHHLVFARLFLVGAYLANVRRTLTRQSSSRIERGFICQRFMQTLARALGIKLRAVEQHVTPILKKLELESRHKAAEWARENRVCLKTCARGLEITSSD